MNFKNIIFTFTIILVSLNSWANEEIVKTIIKKEGQKVGLASYNIPYLEWKKLPIAIYTPSSFPQIFKTAVIEGIQKWNGALKKEIFIYKGTSRVCKKTVINCVILEKHSKYLKESGREDYAFTKQDFTGQYWDGADIFLNDHFKWKPHALIGEVDPSKVVLHELGHVLGLQHHFFHLSSIMNYLPYESGEVNLEISDFDKQIVNWIYFGGECPEQYLLAFIDEQEMLALELVKKTYPNLDSVTDINVLYLLSRLERTANHLDDSLKAINKAIELSNNQQNSIKAYLLNHRADLYYRKEDIKSAKKDFEESLKLWPGNYLTMTYLARIKSAMGEDKKESLRLLKNALIIKPTFELAKDFKKQLENK